MKMPLLFLIMLFTLVSGCTRHSYSLQADRVKFYLQMPGVETVAFASSLDGFRSHRAERVDHRTWMIDLPASREFRYFYTVDGALYLPACPFKEMDDFGFVNCVFVPGM